MTPRVIFERAAVNSFCSAAMSVTGGDENLHLADGPAGGPHELGRDRHPGPLPADAVLQQPAGRVAPPAVPAAPGHAARLHGPAQSAGIHSRHGHQHHTLALYLHTAGVLR